MELIGSESRSGCDATYHINRRLWREAGGNLQELRITLPASRPSPHQQSLRMQGEESHTLPSPSKGLSHCGGAVRPAAVRPSVRHPFSCIQTNVRPLCLLSSSPGCRLHTYLTGCLRQSGAQAPPNVPCKMDLVWCVWKGIERERERESGREGSVEGVKKSQTSMKNG